MEICVTVFSERVAFWLLAGKYMKKRPLTIMVVGIAFSGSNVGQCGFVNRFRESDAATLRFSGSRIIKPLKTPL